MLAQDKEEAGEADGAADAGEGLVGEMLGEVVVATTAGDGTDVLILGEDELEDGAGVVVEATDDFEVGFDLLLEAFGFEEVEGLVEFGEALLISVVVDFEIAKLLDDFGAGTVKVNEGENLFDSGFVEREFFEADFGLLGGDFVGVIDDAHDFFGLVGEV